MAKVKDQEGPSAAAAASAAGAEDPSADGAPDFEADGEDEGGAAERAAEAALVSIGRKRKPESGKKKTAADIKTPDKKRPNKARRFCRQRSRSLRRQRLRC